MRKLHETALMIVGVALLQVALCFLAASPARQPTLTTSALLSAVPDPDPDSDAPADPDAESSDGGGERSDSDDDDSKSSPGRIAMPEPTVVTGPRIVTEENPPPGPHREPLPRPPRA